MVTKFEIIEKDWYKRRAPNTALIIPVSVEIPDYQATHNHMCQMLVTYSDNSQKQLLSRVIYNKLNDVWTVDGMEVAVKVSK